MAANPIEHLIEEISAKVAGGDSEGALSDLGNLKRALVGDEQAVWIGTTRAKRLLGVASENTVKAWAELKILRSTTVRGRTKVHLGDVLREAALRSGPVLGEEQLSSEEVEAIGAGRPGSTPWSRER